MIVYIALCGSTGTINRVIHSTPLGIINEGSDIRELFTGENELDSILRQDSGIGQSCRATMKMEGNPIVFVTVMAMNQQRLVLAYDIDDPSQISRLVEMSLNAAALPELSGQEPYGSGYYEIQKLNSRLINYQRTLAKNNVRLQGLLEEPGRPRTLLKYWNGICSPGCTRKRHSMTKLPAYWLKIRRRLSILLRWILSISKL